MYGVIGLLILIANVIWPSIVIACPDGEPIVETRTGKVRGAKQKNEEGHEFCSFKAIPYAKPPIGQLRFADPQAAEPWQGVREATAYAPVCAQLYTVTGLILGEEDCLYLNVYTRNTKAKQLRPVIFWIYGGYFVWGRSDSLFYGPEYLMLKDIVLVTINYRVGIFGFLNLDDESAAGNQGLKDQVMALQWVRDNIANFGGDPNSVTIAGQNSGGSSTHYLAISPLARNLFHKVISQSAVALSPWTFQENPKEGVSQYLPRLNFTSTDKKATLEFLQAEHYKTLLVAHRNLISKDDKIRCRFHFGPSIDSKSKNPFMPVHPEELAANGIQYPLLLGYTSREGIILYMHVAKVYDRFNGELEQLLNAGTLKMFNSYGLTIEDVKHIYFTDGVLKRENIDQLVDLLGDVYFVEGIQRALKIQIEKSGAPTYFYQFTYDRDRSLMKLVFSANMSGASQYDEIPFLFRYEYMEGRKKFPEKGSEQYTLIERMVGMWVNFATTGVPTLPQSALMNYDWLPVDKENPLQCLNICENPRMMDTAISLERKYTIR